MKFPAFDPIDIKNNAISLLVEELCTSQIFPDSDQPRKTFNESSLNDLASSIKKHGILQPIIVHLKSCDKYEIIAGERRWRAAKIAKIDKIPAIIRQSDPEKNTVISLIENIQRENINPIELAKAFFKLKNDYNLSHEEIGILVGKSRVTVTNLSRLLNLPEEIQELLISGKLDMGHARAILVLPKDEQEKIVDKIISENLTVRDTENLVCSFKQSNKNKFTFYKKEIDIWTSKLSKIFSSKVSIKMSENGRGKLLINFSSIEEIDSLVDELTDKNIKEKIQ